MFNKIIVIIGPTASNKTKLAITLANKFSGEIINADAFQVYKEMKIGTARATDEEKKQATFHLDGEISIYEKWDIKKFQEYAIKIIDKLQLENKTPIIIGGSHLYIDALIKNYDLTLSKVRNDKFTDLTNKELYEKLEEKNKQLAEKITINNRQRLIRALQILEDSNSLNSKKKEKYDYVLVQCDMSRNDLYKRINYRVEKMLELGWIDEVKEIYNHDNDIEKLNAFKAIGYRTILSSIKNNIPIDIERIKTDTRRYAKRQLTWIRNHYQNALIFDQNNLDEIINEITKWLKK